MSPAFMLRVIPVKMGIQVFSLAWILRFAYGEGVSTISDGETTFLSAILLCLLPLSGLSFRLYPSSLFHPFLPPSSSLTILSNGCNNPARLRKRYRPRAFASIEGLGGRG